MDSLLGGIAGLGGVVIFLIAASYFLPTVVAVARHKQNTLAIGALNLFLGWTLLGWVVALVWALTVDKDAIVAQPRLSKSEMLKAELSREFGFGGRQPPPDDHDYRA